MGGEGGRYGGNGPENRDGGLGETEYPGVRTRTCL